MVGGGGRKKRKKFKKKEIPPKSANIVGVQGIHAIVFRCDEKDVVNPFALYIETRHIQGLRIDITINGVAEELPEGDGAYIRGRQICFAQIIARSAVVIVIGQDIDLGVRN